MTTLGKRGTNVDATSGSTWASTGNAVDGTYGNNDATYATWTSTSRNATADLDIGGFDFSAIPAGSTINSVTVYLRHYESDISLFDYVYIAPYDGTSIGTSQDATLSATATTFSYASWSITLTQLQSANFFIRVEADRKNTTTQSILYVDYVDILVDYTAAGVTANAGLGAATATGYTAAPATSAAAGLGATTVTGYAATADQSVPSGLGAATAVGYDAVPNRTNVAGPGAATVTGHDAQAQVSGGDIQVNAGLGAATVAGYDAAPSTTSVAAGLGAASVTGYAASAQISGGSVTSNAGLGAASVTGHDATASVSVTPTAGAVSVTGYTAITDRTNVAGLGAATATGYAAAVSTGTLILELPLHATLATDGRTAATLATDGRTAATLATDGRTTAEVTS